jgi:hypothetical protein
MSNESQGVTVKIGRFDLRLAPLEQKDLAFATDTARRLKASFNRRLSSEWFTACRDALGLVFLSSRKNHPSLSLAQLTDSATQEQTVEALRVVSQVTLENALRYGIN